MARESFGDIWGSPNAYQCSDSRTARHAGAALGHYSLGAQSLTSGYRPVVAYMKCMGGMKTSLGRAGRSHEPGEQLQARWMP